MKERELWKKLNDNKKNRFLVDKYLKDRVEVERYSPPLAVPLMGGGIAGLMVLYLLSFYPPLLYIIVVLSLLLVSEVLLYNSRKNKIINYYYSECEKNGK